MAGKIFINYRRNDDAGFTQALYLRLEYEFGPDNLFMDVEGHIKPGDDFVQVVNAKVAGADVVLVVIGPRWADLLATRHGDRDDYVVNEIKAALDQKKRVIPLLVGGADMPRADMLPKAIRPLTRRNAVGLRPERFKADCQGLVTALKESLAAAEQERAARTEAERRAAEAVRLEAEAQAAARAKAAEERGREQAAAGLTAEQIRKAEELASWDFVKDRNDTQDLRDHLARFPGGPTERWAQAKLDGLVWAGLGSTPAIEGLRSYLAEFPKGANAGAAQARIARLESDAAEARVAEQQRAAQDDRDRGEGRIKIDAGIIHGARDGTMQIQIYPNDIYNRDYIEKAVATALSGFSDQITRTEVNFYGAGRGGAEFKHCDIVVHFQGRQPIKVGAYAYHYGPPPRELEAFKESLKKLQEAMLRP